jgi:hypothetical protein
MLLRRSREASFAQRAILDTLAHRVVGAVVEDELSETGIGKLAWLQPLAECVVTGRNGDASHARILQSGALRIIGTDEQTCL